MTTRTDASILLFLKPQEMLLTQEQAKSLDPQVPTPATLRNVGDGLRATLHFAAHAMEVLTKAGWGVEMTLYDLVFFPPKPMNTSSVKNALRKFGLDPKMFNYFEDDDVDEDEAADEDEEAGNSKPIVSAIPRSVPMRIGAVCGVDGDADYGTASGEFKAAKSPDLSAVSGASHV